MLFATIKYISATLVWGSYVELALHNDSSLDSDLDLMLHNADSVPT